MAILNGESWIALAIIISSVLTAWFMNYRTPRVRAFGTLLAAMGCLAIVIWFAIILGTGILENPKPNQTPLDSAKPTMLWLRTAVALGAALMLLLAAYRQAKTSEALELRLENESDRYGFVSRMLHWTTAILFITLIPIGIFASMIPEDTWFRNHYYVVHKTIGVLVFCSASSSVTLEPKIKASRARCFTQTGGA